MELGELVAIGLPEDHFRDKCPFRQEDQGVDDEEEEGIANDDKDEVQAEQQNSGGTLGQNLEARSGGAGVGGPFPPDDYLELSDDEALPRDTRRAGVKLKVPAAGDVDEGEYPFTVAAHHLIPGNASMGPSALYDYLGPSGTGKLKKSGKVRKRADIESDGGTWKIKKMIGYNINGAHNGAWLPGNYAIRQHSSPVGVTWGSMDPRYDEWKLAYVAAAIKGAGGQFHDTHTDYSRKVLARLNDMATALRSHLDVCKDCEKKKPEVPPPFEIKLYLYAFSEYLRNQVTANFTEWRAPWFTSDSWSKTIFKDKDTYERFRSFWIDAGKVE